MIALFLLSMCNIPSKFFPKIACSLVKNFAKFSFVSLTTISGGTEDRIYFDLIVAHICPSVNSFYIFV